MPMPIPMPMPRFPNGPNCPGFWYTYLTLSFTVIHTLNARKNITTLRSTKILFWKHSIRTLECYFERHTFDSIINIGKLVQKLSSEQFFFFFFVSIKVESSSRFLKFISEFINGNKNKNIAFLF